MNLKKLLWGFRELRLGRFLAPHLSQSDYSMRVNYCLGEVGGKRFYKSVQVEQLELLAGILRLGVMALLFPTGRAAWPRAGATLRDLQTWNSVPTSSWLFLGLVSVIEKSFFLFMAARASYGSSWAGVKGAILWQCWILNPLRQAREWTHIIMVTTLCP